MTKEEYTAFYNELVNAQSAELHSFDKRKGVYDEKKTDYGWTVGTAAYPYRNPGMPEGHSGPGMAGLTSKLFTDWWEFTRDRDILEKYVYPSVHGVSKSLVSSVEEINGEYEKETGKVIAAHFEDNGLNPAYVPCVLARHHGPFAWGKDAMDAVHNAVVMEEVAFMDWHAMIINPERGNMQQALMDKHYLRKHGANAYYGQN